MSRRGGTSVAPAAIKLGVFVSKRGVGQAVPERERRGRVKVADSLAVLPERRRQVSVRLAARVAGHFDWQFAGWVNPARKHARDRGTALLAGEEGLHGSPRSILVLPKCVRPS